MKVRVFSLRLDAATGTFDDSVVAEFLREREALSVTDHVLMHEGIPTLVLIVTWREGKTAATPSPRAEAPDPSLELDPADKAAFEALRRWRNERGRREGKPVYLYLNNRNANAPSNRNNNVGLRLTSSRQAPSGAARWGAVTAASPVPGS